MGKRLRSNIAVEVNRDHKNWVKNPGNLRRLDHVIFNTKVKSGGNLEIEVIRVAERMKPINIQ